MSLTLRQLAETAAFASARSTILLEGRRQIPETWLQEYWKCSRGRLVEWLRSLDALASEASVCERADQAGVWSRAEPTIAEIFVSEILTRVWAAVLTANDRNHQTCRAEPIARNTMKGHIEARNRAMTLMLSDIAVPVESLAKMDRLRRKAERWSDLLIGHLVVSYQLDELAFESDRSVEFGESQLKEILKATDEPVWEFVLTGIRLAFSTTESNPATTGVWNRGIVQSVLCSFPSDSFSESGLFKSIRRVRLENRDDGSSVLDDAIVASSIPDNAPAGRLRFAELKQRFGRN